MYCFYLKDIIALSVVYTILFHAINELFTLPKWIKTDFGNDHYYMPFLTLFSYWLLTNTAAILGNTLKDTKCTYVTL